MVLPRSLELRIRGIVKRVHEQRLAESLAPVEESLRRWRSGEGSIFAIDEALHQHQMRSRRYWHLYANTAVTSPEVAYILDEARDLKLITPEQHKEIVALWNRPRTKAR